MKSNCSLSSCHLIRRLNFSSELALCFLIFWIKYEDSTKGGKLKHRQIGFIYLKKGLNETSVASDEADIQLSTAFSAWKNIQISVCVYMYSMWSVLAERIYIVSQLH